MAIKFLKYWFPVLVFMLIIFYFSSQPYQKQDLRPRLQNVISQEYVQNHFSSIKVRYGHEIISVNNNGAYGFVEFFIRKGAHLMLYSSLGFLAARALYNASVRYAFYFVLVGCFAYAGSDEFHQYLTGNRTPLFADVLLDTCGALVGAFIYYGTIKIRTV